MNLPDRERLIREAAELLAAKYGVPIALIDARLGHVTVPSDVFTRDLAPFETIVKYLRETLALRPAEIARLTGRDPRAIGVTYRRACVKVPGPLPRGISKDAFPVGMLKDRSLSVLEHLVVYLRRSESLAEIGRSIKRDPRTIGTIARRAARK